MKIVLSRCLQIVLFCLALAAPVSLMAQSTNLLLLPDSLKKGAGAVMQEREFVLEIKSPGKAIQHDHVIYTILDESGDYLAHYTSFYDKFNTINSITGTLYDATGREVKRVKKKDMEDKSVVDGFSLMNDARYKDFDFFYRVYPYTVDYEEEDDFSGILYFENWSPLRAPQVSTAYSKYVIIAPKDYQIRYKPVNCAYQPVITTSGDKKIYTWEARDLPARYTEGSGPSWQEIAPHVLMGPTDFEADGYKGNMSTWVDYGKFINQLRIGRDVLPDDIKKKVHELTDDLKDPRQKIYVLYDFLQKNTHYISIQLGIGGWQPFPADYVATKRYGDCKALSNYMIALLKESGITGKYVEIQCGKDAAPMIEDFCSSQFNHAICCVPVGRDTIWLECTSQTESPGFMGSFTGGRKCILIDAEGGHIVQTPTYSAADNLQSRVVNAEISEDGNLDAEVNTTYTGLSQEFPRSLMYNYSGDQREKYLNELFNLPTYKVEKSSYEEEKGALPVVKEYLHVLSPNYANVSGRRLFIAPDLFDKSNTRLAADSTRKYDFLCDQAYKHIDSISIKIPAGYQPESVPREIHIENKFGKYSASMKVLTDRIIYYRSNEESVNRYPPSDYPQLVKFYEQMYKADHTRIVLVKKDP